MKTADELIHSCGHPFLDHAMNPPMRCLDRCKCKGLTVEERILLLDTMLREIMITEWCRKSQPKGIA